MKKHGLIFLFLALLFLVPVNSYSSSYGLRRNIPISMFRVLLHMALAGRGFFLVWSFGDVRYPSADGSTIGGAEAFFLEV